MREVWFIIDKMSFLSQAHFFACSESARQAARVLHKEDGDRPFGNCHVILVGDFMQHHPTSGTPLYASLRHADHPTTASHKLELGRQLYSRFTTIFVLRSQHRFSVQQTAGARLLDLARCFTDPKLSRDKMATLCDELNSRAITTIDPFLMPIHTWSSYATPPAFPSIATYCCSVPLFSVSSTSHHSTTAKSVPVPASISKIFLNFPADKPAHLNTVQFYFYDMEYVFIDNEWPHLGRVPNKRCLEVLY
jgi:hypothetical protein